MEYAKSFRIEKNQRVYGGNALMVGVSMRSTMDRYIKSPMEGFKTGYS